MRAALAMVLGLLLGCGDRSGSGNAGSAGTTGGGGVSSGSTGTDGGMGDGPGTDAGTETGTGTGSETGTTGQPVVPHWEARADLLQPRQEIGVAALDGKVYVVGGFVLDAQGQSTMVPALEVYDPEADSWTRLADFPELLHHANVAAVDGELYVVGFLVASFGERGEAFVYDPGTDAWRPGTPLPAGTERGASGVVVIEDRIWVIGGLRGGQAVADVWAYDVGDDEWVIGPPLTGGRDHMAVGVIDGVIYVAGGRGGGIQDHTDRVDILDPASGAWTMGAPMPTSRGGMAGAVLDGRLYVTGGEGNAATATGVFEEHEVYDPTTDSWEALTPMITPRHGMGAAAVGQVLYVPGGAVEEAIGLGPATHEAWITG